MKAFIFTIILTISAVANAKSSFIEEYSGTKVKCQVGYVNQEIFKGIPVDVDLDFKLIKIILKFDDKDVRKFYRDTMSVDPDNLFIVTYEIKSNEANITSNFVFDKRITTQETNDEGDEVISHINGQKSLELTAHDGMIKDKYVFVKNGKKLFTCTRLDLF